MVQRTTATEIQCSLNRGHNTPATVAELARRVSAMPGTARRVVNRMILRGQLERAGVRKCKVKKADLYTYKLV